MYSMERTENHRVRRVSLGSQTAEENRKYELPLLPYAKEGFNEQLHVPSGDAAMKAGLFLFLFILLSSFRHEIHYSFQSSEGEQDTATSSLLFSQAEFTSIEVCIKSCFVQILIAIVQHVQSSQ